jgi:phosphoglycolate phosphatase
MAVATLVFDLDGTLVDSVPDIAAALNRLLVARGLTGFVRSAVAGMVGDGSRRLVERAFAARGATADEAAVAAFLADYADHAAVLTELYPGVRPTLAQLVERGWRLALCTNKAAAPTHALLAAFSLTPLFAAIGAGDSFAVHKPDPAHLTATIAAAGGTPARSIMIGDHANDIAAAQGAGVPSIFAAWGYGTAAMATQATAVARGFPEIAELAPRLLR